MLALEARRMDYRTIVLDPDLNAPAAIVADDQIAAELTDIEAARLLASRCDVVTLEWENANVVAVRALAELVPVHPSPKVLEVAQNRLSEKEAALDLGLETAPFRPVRSLVDLEEALADLGTPAVLKTVFGGYDGRGQRSISSPGEAASAFEELQGGNRELILEGGGNFDLEASVICARSADGSLATFPVVENIHRTGILDITIAPARISETVRKQAVAAAERMTSGLEVVGLLAVELFIDSGGRVLVNEIAPRPHNSGHYTWEACSVSQFEQQVRAICGLPLHEPALLRPAAMANLLGEHIGTGRELSSIVDALDHPMVSLHLYGKAKGRPGRKMGHLTALADDAEAALNRVTAARAALVRGFLRASESR
jgi:5-(carboxyamino)imidazole ribonucleotide synthase